MAVEEDVLAANAAFYRAFNARDIGAMERLWAEHTMIACVHPGWVPLFGREAIMESWRAILLGAGAPEVRCSNPVVHLVNQTSAFVVCIEVLPGGPLAATNVFVIESGAWRLVQHHASPVATMPVDDDDDTTVH